MKALENVDIQLIKETFQLPEWTPISIAQTLECSEQSVRYYARTMGLKRPKNKSGQRSATDDKDWETLYYAITSGYSYEDAAEAAGMTVAQGRSAMLKMIHMTEAERILRWNRYRVAHGVPLFTKC